MNNDKFIEENMGLVHLCAKRFINRGTEYEDLIQIGSVGLLKAAANFDVDRGLKFSTYAVPVIMGEIKGYFRNDGIIKISRKIKELSIKINAVINKFTVKNGVVPSVSQIAVELNVSEDEVAQAMSICVTALSLTVGEDGENQIDIPIDSAEEEITDKLSLRKILKDLSDEDRELIELRYFKSKTQTEVAKAVGCSQVQISRREKKILLFLREKMNE